jgi:glycosyltransferase involved in cell wall biosynthesis
MQIGIVVPCYNEEEVLPETSRRLSGLLAKLKEEKLISETSQIWFIDDGSVDRTWEIIEQLSTDTSHIRGIKLSTNRGHQNALLAGLLTADGEALVSIDADLQDDISVIEQMIREHKDGQEIVYGVRKSRGTDSRFKRITAKLFYRFLRVMGAKTVYNHADFRLMGRSSIEALRSFGEVNLFLRGMVPLIGFTSTTIYYDRADRFAGETKYPLKKMLALAIDGITSFSVAPLRIITLLGFLVFLFSIAMIMWTLWVRLFTDQAIPGWASTVLPIYLIAGVQILCIGVIGEYLGKIYIEVKARPRFIIEKTTGSTVPK